MSVRPENIESQYQQVQRSLPGIDLPWLTQNRQQALARFTEEGFPTPRDEDWRYTSLRPILNRPFQVVLDCLSHHEVFYDEISNLDSYRAVFIDGRFSPDHSALADIENKVKIQPMAVVLAEQPELLETYLDSVTGEGSQAFTALNTVFFADGYVIQIESGVKLQKPIELVFVTQSELVANFPKNLVLAGENSQVHIIERHCSKAGIKSFTNSNTEFILTKNAQIDFYLLQTQSVNGHQITGIWVKQASFSRFSFYSVTLGGGIVRNTVHTALQGDGAHCDMLGVYSLKGKQHVDNHTTMLHEAPHCTSNEQYKGILDQRAQGVFHGRINVLPEAQKTDARQSNKTLLLSEYAEINTKPQLEIYADDVKCAHGATVGQIDKEALFYLLSRGIDKCQAQILLTEAFVSDVVQTIPIEPLKSYVLKKMSEQLNIEALGQINEAS